MREVVRVDDELRAAMLALLGGRQQCRGSRQVRPAGHRRRYGAGARAPGLRRCTSTATSSSSCSVDGEPAGFAGLVTSAHVLKRHWASVLRVQVHPSRQGTGLGGCCSRACTTPRERHGWEFVGLTVRGGTGTEAFYRAFGYREVGRIPAAPARRRPVTTATRSRWCVRSDARVRPRLDGMTPPVARRERLVGMLLFGVAVVLLVSSPTWFASDRVGVGIAQIVLGLAVGAAGVWVGRRAQRAD